MDRQPNKIIHCLCHAFVGVSLFLILRTGEFWNPSLHCLFSHWGTQQEFSLLSAMSIDCITPCAALPPRKQCWLLFDLVPCSEQETTSGRPFVFQSPRPGGYWTDGLGQPSTEFPCLVLSFCWMLPGDDAAMLAASRVRMIVKSKLPLEPQAAPTYWTPTGTCNLIVMV